MFLNHQRKVLTSGIKVNKLKTMVRTILSASVKAEYNLRYEEAVKTLNTLQTNAQTLEKIRQSRDKYAHRNIPRMVKFVERAGIQMADVDRLNIIHVSGTKGKGSTCAYCESILRHHGYKTGFFSSPHLVEVRERFCVDGSPLERDKFANYFWEVYNRLEKSKAEHNGDMPNYFGFLTVMAMHVFLKEKVDVAIVEVGIGGQYDSTNFLRKPVVCGISSLGIDHTSILGTTVDKIAWHKSGIFKKDVPAFTVKQAPEAMEVIQERAKEIGTPLLVCPDLQQCGTLPTLGIQGSVQTLNASLALQLCSTWLSVKKGNSVESDLVEGPVPNGQGEPIPGGSADASFCDIPVARPIQLTQEYLNGLKNCRWLGRNQTIAWPGITFYLDGAHTFESIQQCVDWFNTQSDREAKKHKIVHKVLIFNTTGDRDTTKLMTPLLTSSYSRSFAFSGRSVQLGIHMSCQFNSALFCPNIAYETAMSADQTNNTVTKESQFGRCDTNKHTWQQLTTTTKPVNGHACSNGTAADGDTCGITNPGHQCSVETLGSIEHCINWVLKQRGSEPSGAGDILTWNGYLSEIKDNFNSTDAESVIKKPKLDCENIKNGDCGGGEHISDGQHLQVLITGSIHLVGGALRVIWDKGGKDKDVAVE